MLLFSPETFDNIYRTFRFSFTAVLRFLAKDNWMYKFEMLLLYGSLEAMHAG